MPRVPTWLTSGAGAALLLHIFLFNIPGPIMFYLCTCRGFTNLRRSMYSLCAVLCLSGVLVSAYGIYAAALNAREFSFFDRAIVTTIAIMAVVQVRTRICPQIRPSCF